MSKFTLEEIASFLIEFERLEKKRPEKGSKHFSRLTRLGDILEGISLTGNQVVELQRYGFSLITEDHIKDSVFYTELKKEHEKLEYKYNQLEERYKTLVKQAEMEFGPQFRLKDLIDRQQKETLEERFL